MNSYVSNFNSNRHESVCKRVYFNNVFSQIRVNSNSYSILFCGGDVVDEFVSISNVSGLWPFQCVSCMQATSTCLLSRRSASSRLRPVKVPMLSVANHILIGFEWACFFSRLRPLVGNPCSFFTLVGCHQRVAYGGRPSFIANISGVQLHEVCDRK